jgi:hypothetical protein
MYFPIVSMDTGSKGQSVVSDGLSSLESVMPKLQRSVAVQRRLGAKLPPELRKCHRKDGIFEALSHNHWHPIRRPVKPTSPIAG